MRNKKAQFYLIAAMVIVAIIIGFATLSSNFVNSKVDKSKVYKMFGQLELGEEEVLNYSKNPNVNENDLQSFTEKYSMYLAGNEKIYFIVSNNGTNVAFSYDYATKESVSFSVVEGKIKITIQDVEYEFNVENYVLIFQEKDDEQYVVEG